VKARFFKELACSLVVAAPLVAAPLGAVVLGAVVLGTAACGGPRMERPPAVHADFRAIQRAEASLARSTALAEDGTLACDARCDAAREARDASDEACRIAGGTDDADAQTRCARASGRANAARLALDLSCTCGATR